MNESKDSEKEYPLVAKARAGDLESFAGLVDLYAKRIYHIVLKLVESPAEAEDVLQETFLNAFEKLHTFRGESNFFTWIVQIAVNAALQRLRKRRKHPTVSLDELYEDDDHFMPKHIVVWDENPEKLYSRKETRRILGDAISSLAVPYRTVFLLKDVEKMPMADVAKVLKISVPAAKSRLIRARLELRESLSRFFRKKGAVPHRGPHSHDA
ncbi:MAG: sigma-70 family RNA polymerase sigma factor [Terriglobia bacterium]